MGDVSCNYGEEMSRTDYSYSVSKFGVRIIIVLALLVLNSGCSTIYTHNFSQENNDCSTCSTLPWVYSGVMYDLCYTKYPEAGLIIFLDAPFSFVADTVVLPYTIYKQYSEGSICKDRKFNNSKTE